MEIAGGILAGILETVFVYLIWKKYNIFESDCGKYKKTIIFILLALASVFLSVMLLCRNYAMVTCVNFMVLYTILASVAGIDFKTKTIPNKILLTGLIIRILLISVEAVFFSDGIKQTFINSGIGFAFGLIFMLFLSIISKHGIGYGDVKLFAWIGLCVGLLDTYNILFYSVLVAAVAGIYLLVIKNKSKKMQLPFAPFVFIGTYIVLCLNML